MNKSFTYKCSTCGQEFPADSKHYICPLDQGNLDILLDYENIRQNYKISDIKISSEFSMWRYLPLLPVDMPKGENTPLTSVGWTPIYSPKALSEVLNIKHFWVKDESKNPTASFKDRASAVVVARAREINAEVIVTASTGNAGAALAGMSAAIGQKAVIFAPKTAPPAKVAQLLVYGAQVLLVDGNYDQAFDLSVEVSKEFGWYCRNTGYNPFTAEGKKTAAFEIWEQIILANNVSKTLCVFVSVGDGNIISGLHKGFKDLVALGWLENMPRIFGVQSSGSSAIANAFFSGKEEILPVKAQTIADSISVDLPRDGVRALRAARDTNGAYIIVEDEEIIKAISSLGKVGIFAEPAGAASYAGVCKARKEGLIDCDSTVVALVTGSGLKDTKAAMQAVPEAKIIEPTISAVKKILKD